ncbi:hypothetical protein ACQ4PT_028197 [Festuca glaucescens]
MPALQLPIAGGSPPWHLTPRCSPHRPPSWGRRPGVHPAVPAAASPAAQTARGRKHHHDAPGAAAPASPRGGHAKPRPGPAHAGPPPHTDQGSRPGHHATRPTHPCCQDQHRAWPHACRPCPEQPAAAPTTRAATPARHGPDRAQDGPHRPPPMLQRHARAAASHIAQPRITSAAAADGAPGPPPWLPLPYRLRPTRAGLPQPSEHGIPPPPSETRPAATAAVASGSGGGARVAPSVAWGATRGAGLIRCQLRPQRTCEEEGDPVEQIRGKKCLVIEPKLAGTLSLILQTSVLKEYGAELRILSADPLQTECPKVVYLVRSQPNYMRFVANQIKNDEPKGLQREYFLYFVPCRTVSCEKILEEEKVHQKLIIGEYPLYLVPLDEDVLSFELDYSLQECLIEGDTSSVWHVAKAIHKLEMGMPEIDTLILLDRQVDMVTPMCSQLTYEGLLDEMLEIHNGTVEVDASIMGAQQDGKKVKVSLNSSDKLYKEIRDLNLHVVVQVVYQKATSIQQDYAQVKSTNSVSELKDFVKRLHSLPEIAVFRVH